jgi:Restriction endonuclease
MPNAEPPVTPAPNLLPFHREGFTWTNFESFCEDLVKAHFRITGVHRYGTPGEKQHGIDFTFSELDGNSWTAQCRRVKVFTVADAKGVVEGTTIKADHHLITVSSEVSKKVRDYVRKQTTWELWDGRDLARNTRDLPPTLGRKIIATHFGTGWVRPFLRIPEFATFVPARDAFPEPRSAILNHHWALVGRAKELDALLSFAGDEEHTVALLTGHGGIGKTRLLKAVSDRLPIGTAYLVEDMPVTPESVNELPLEPTLLLVDDAHRRDDSLRQLLAACKQRPTPTKLLLTARPYALPYLNATLAAAGTDHRRILRVGPLRPLRAQDSEQLALEALGPSLQHLAPQLASITGDSPLITVIGAQLLVSEHINPALLSTTETFRDAVLARFIDVIKGELRTSTTPALAKQVLELIAAAQPITLRDDGLATSAAGFLQIAPSMFRQLTGELEAAGVLRRRGDSLRITPDVLADYLLYHRSLTDAGEPTGYATEVFESLRGTVAAGAVLRNLAELDWRVRASGRSADLLDGIWTAITTEYKNASDGRRAEFLDELTEVAAYQPASVLALVELTLQEPNVDPELRRRLPGLLRNIALHERLLPRALDLLWELARDDTSGRSDEPGRPLQILHDLASYEPGKPLRFNQLVLEAVERWTNNPTPHAHFPLEILDPLLAKTGLTTQSTFLEVQFREFAISPHATRAVREGARRVLARATHDLNPRIVRHSIKLLVEVASRPIAYLGRPVGDVQTAAWQDEREWAMQVLGELADRTRDTTIAAELFDALRWHAQRESNEKLRTLAMNIVTRMSAASDVRLIQYLTRGYRDLLEASDDTPEAIRMPPATAVVDNLRASHPDGSAAAEYLNNELGRLEAAGAKTDPADFLVKLAMHAPAYAQQIAQAILEGKAPALKGYLSAVLSPVREHDPVAARIVARQALETGDAVFVQGVANAYTTWFRFPAAEDWGVLKTLLASSTGNARAMAIRTLGGLARHNPATVIEELRRIEIGRDQALASALCHALTQDGVAAANLTEDLAREFLAKLESTPNISEYNICTFLNGIGARFSRLLVDWFERRIIRDLRDESGGYHALPFEGSVLDLSSIAESPEYGDLLRQVRDHAHGATGIASYWYPQLFTRLAVGYSERSLRALEEWLDPPQDARVCTVSHLVRGAPSPFVFQHRAFVERLLGAATLAGADCLREVTTDLYQTALYGERFGTWGEPFPEDVQAREQASAVLEDLPGGSPARAFYEVIRESAGHRIDAQLQESEEMGR